MYNILFERYPKPVIVAYADNLTVKYLNAQARTFFSIADAGGLGKLSDIIKPKAEGELDIAIQAALAEGSAADRVLAFETGGKTVWASLDITVVNDDGGSREVMLVFSQLHADAEISGQENSGAPRLFGRDPKLEAENAFLGALHRVLNNIKIPIYIAEKGSRLILFANDSVKEIVGKDVEGKPCWTVFEGDSNICEGCLCARAEAEGRANKSISGDYYNKKLGKWFHCTHNFIEWIDGREAHLLINFDVTDRKRQEEELTRYANYDIMTGIYNRGFGIKMLDELIQSTKKNDIILTLCYFDIDDLKSINDGYGHAEGDRIIKLLTSTVRESIRKRDVFVRVGGDEFVLGLYGCTLNDASRVMDTINRKINDINESGQLPYKVSFSVGFEEVNPSENYEIDEIVRRADENMYKQKHGCADGSLD